VDFNIMSIRGFGDRGDPYFYPALDNEGRFLGEEGDRSAARLAFSNVKIMRDAVVVFESEHALDGKLFITDSRVVLLCENYQSGNIIWVGGLVGALIASTASNAMAKQRTSGTVLCGQVRYEWLDNVTASSERFLLGLGDETIVISYRGSGYSLWSVVVTLKDVKGIATKTCAEIMRRSTLFKQDPPPKEGDKARKPHQLPAANALYCTKCGGKIKTPDAYCKHCGAKT